MAGSDGACITDSDTDNGILEFCACITDTDTKNSILEDGVYTTDSNNIVLASIDSVHSDPDIYVSQIQASPLPPPPPPPPTLQPG